MTSSASCTLPDAPRLLVVRPDRVGDVIISTSCIEPIRRRFPRGKLFFAAAARMRPLLEGHPDLEGFLSDPSQIDHLALDAVVHLHSDPEWHRATERADFPVRIGYAGAPASGCLTHTLADHRLEGRKHEAEYIFDLLRLLDIEAPSPCRASVRLPGAALSSLQSKLPWPVDTTRFAVLHPSAHSRIARWPVESFVRLGEWMRDSLDLRVVVTGADANDSLPPGMPGFLDLAGRTELGELGWLLQHAHVLVTRDTGPSHLAAAVGCRQVVLFGRTAPLYGPTRWAPLTDQAVVVSATLPRRWWEGRNRHWRRCFASIRVEEVQSAVQRALAFPTGTIARSSATAPSTTRHSPQ